MYNYESSPTLTNVTFSGNFAGKRGGGIFNGWDGDLVLTGATFIGNWAEVGGGLANHERSSATLRGVIFRGNSAGWGAGMRNWQSSAELVNVAFIGNSAQVDAGGLYHTERSSAELVNVTFIGNSAEEGSGGGVYVSVSEPTLVNVTFSGNSAGENGGGMFNRISSRSTLTNCVLWGNTAVGEGDQIWSDETSEAEVSYSDIEGEAGVVWPGIGNINANPLFMDAAGGDLRLRPGSPAIDAGDNSAVAGVTTDLAGWARIINGTVDMGAYETPLAAYLPLVLRGAP